MIAVIFVGMCFIAIGIFISSLTANQFTAGLGTIGVLLALMGISLSNSLIDFYPVRKVLAFISIYARYAAFTKRDIRFFRGVLLPFDMRDLSVPRLPRL